MSQLPVLTNEDIDFDDLDLPELPSLALGKEQSKAYGNNFLPAMPKAPPAPFTQN